MRVIGLSGGIGSGKSSVAKFLCQHEGVAHLNTDTMAHQAYAPNSDCLKSIVSIFGSDILDENGSINRPFLGKLVFGTTPECKNNLSKLESVVTPYVVTMVKNNLNRLRNEGYNLVILECATFEKFSSLKELTDSIWLVVISTERAIDRLFKRGMKVDIAAQRIASQPTTEERIALLHPKVIISNEGTFEQLREKIESHYNSLQDEKNNH